MIDYDNTATYQKGNYCMYNNSLYVANQDIDTAEEFDSSHWDETSVINELEGVNKFNNYSITEQRIGTRNGKPLYAKIVQTTVNHPSSAGYSVTTYNTAHNIANVDIIYVNYGKSYSYDGGIFSPLNNLYPGGTNQTNIYFWTRTYVDRTKIITQVKINEAMTLNNYIVIEYTKTTD